MALFMPTWKPEEIEHVKKWWLAKSARLIAEDLGRTRGSVMGQAFRLGLIKKRAYYKEHGLNLQPSKYNVSGKRQRKPRPPAPPAYLGLGDFPPTCDPVGLMALSMAQCHAPTDLKGPDGLMMYCGEGVCRRLVKKDMDWEYTDASYCAYHYRRFNKVR